MADESRPTIRRVTANDIPLMNDLLTMFGEAFGEPETYCEARPSADYLRRLLDGDCFIALAALEGDDVVGGIAAYELHKFEQERSEIYVYDLAVAEGHRRRGVATALFDELKILAAERGAYVIFVQADRGDEPATALYSGLGEREDVLHFDIDVPRRRDTRTGRRPR